MARSTKTRSTPTALSSLQVGVASADITPPVGIILAGYRDRVSTSLGHRLRAEALVCGEGRSRWALVITETLGFPLVFTKALRRAITKRTGIPGNRVLLSATHTHSGPVTHAAKLRRGSLEARYNRTLQGILTDLVVKAARSASPGSLEVATCHAPQWGHNRRIRMPDGTWGNEWWDPKLRHRGYFDPSILLLGVRRPDGRLDALLVNFGCHPVVLGPQSLAISSDYVGYLKDALERRRIAGTAIFALAGHGNINPPVCIRRSPAQAKRMGAALARIIAAAVPKLRPVAGGQVGAAIAPWHLRRTRPAPSGKGLSGKVLHTEVMALSAGDLGIVSIPGELCSEFTALFRAASPFTNTIVLSLGNDYLGYFPTDRTVAEGGYEARMAPALIEKPLRRLAKQALAATQEG